MYVPMCHRYPESQENPARLRRVIEEAEARLMQGGISAHDVARLLDPARELERDGESLRRGGVHATALLLAADFCRCYRLPFDCPQTVDVGKAFYLAPLVRLLDWPVECFVLALSMNSVRLFRCTRDELHSIEVPAPTPQSESDYLAGTDVGRPLRFQTSVGTPPAGGQVMSVHSQTSYKDDAKLRRHEYVQVVARQVARQLEPESSPLVLAAVKELHPVFQQAYTGSDLIEPGIHGSPDELSDVEIREQAVRLVEARHAGEVQAVCERYGRAAHTPRGTNQLDQIVAAAAQGRIDSLVAGFGQRIWGAWDPQPQRVSFRTDRPDRMDLIDLALRETLRHGGHVCVVPPQEVPDGAVAVAVLRW